MRLGATAGNIWVLGLEHEELDPRVRSAALDGKALLGREFDVIDVAAHAHDMIDVMAGKPDPARLIRYRRDRLAKRGGGCGQGRDQRPGNAGDRQRTRLNSRPYCAHRMPSSSRIHK